MEQNHTTSEHIEMMLEVWADWANRGIINGIGWSRLSNIGMIMENGGLFIRATGPKYPPDNVLAEQMDHWICDLKKEHSLEAEVISLFYFAGWMKERIARVLKIGVRMVEYRLKFGKLLLEGMFMEKRRLPYIDTESGKWSNKSSLDSSL